MPNITSYPSVIVKIVVAYRGVARVKFTRFPVRIRARKVDTNVLSKPFSVHCPDPWGKTGALSQAGRTAVIEATQRWSSLQGLRMCVAFGPDDVAYIEPDGRVTPSSKPPFSRDFYYMPYMPSSDEEEYRSHR